MSLQISMVLFNELPTFSMQAMQAAFSAHWPTLPAATFLQQKEDAIAFDLDGAQVVIGLMPAPYPWSDLEGPCATSILWPDAASQVPGHKYHAIVTVSVELPPLALSGLLTQVTAALLASSEQALGVYWSNAALLVPKDLFVTFATRILPEGVPLPIWVDFRAGWTQEGALSAGFSTGLAALGMMEIEAHDASESPDELRDRMEGIVYYLLEHGPVIQDGDTIGESASEHIRVVYAQSEFGIETTVMRLVYDAAPQDQ